MKRFLFISYKFYLSGFGDEPLPILSIFIKKYADLVINFANLTAIVQN